MTYCGVKYDTVYKAVNNNNSGFHSYHEYEQLIYKVNVSNGNKRKGRKSIFRKSNSCRYERNSSMLVSHDQFKKLKESMLSKKLDNVKSALEQIFGMGVITNIQRGRRLANTIGGYGYHTYRAKGTNLVLRNNNFEFHEIGLNFKPGKADINVVLKVKPIESQIVLYKEWGPNLIEFCSKVYELNIHLNCVDKPVTTINNLWAEFCMYLPRPTRSSFKCVDTRRFSY